MAKNNSTSKPQSAINELRQAVAKNQNQTAQKSTRLKKQKSKRKSPSRTSRTSLMPNGEKFRPQDAVFNSEITTYKFRTFKTSQRLQKPLAKIEKASKKYQIYLGFIFFIDAIMILIGAVAEIPLIVIFAVIGLILSIIEFILTNKTRKHNASIKQYGYMVLLQYFKCTLRIIVSVVLLILSLITLSNIYQSVTANGGTINQETIIYIIAFSIAFVLPGVVYLISIYFFYLTVKVFQKYADDYEEYCNRYLMRKNKNHQEV